MPETQAASKAREYETIYVLRPEVSRDTQEKIAARVGEIVGREGGQLTQLENWGRRQLAYAVAKRRRGVYVYAKYVGGGALVSEIERNLRMLDDVLKYQTVQVRDDVDPATLAVAPEQVKFEAVEPPAEDEPEESLERQLGLVDAPERERPPPDEAASDDEGEFEAEAPAEEEES